MITENSEEKSDKLKYLPLKSDNSSKYINYLRGELDNRPEMQKAISEMYNLELQARKGESILDEQGRTIAYDGTQAIPEQVYEMVARRNGLQTFELRSSYIPMRLTSSNDDSIE